jgi:molybdopterin synthase sulfur carrier subunit
MPSVWIPALMRNLTQGQQSVQIPGHTLRELIDALDAAYPGIRTRLCDGDTIRPGISVVIDSQVSRAGLAETVNENSEVHFIPAIAGGSESFVIGP